GQVDYLDGIGDAPVHAIIADSTGIMWIGTGNGLHAVDPVTDDVTTYRHDSDNPNSLAGNDIRHLAFDLQGRLWVGTWGTGLDNLDTVSGIAEHHRSIAAGGQLASGFVSALTHTPGGVLWVGTTGLSRDQQALHQYDFKAFVRHVHNPNLSYSLSPGGVTVVLEDHAQLLWVGTDESGINAFDQGSSPIPHFQAIEGDPSSLGWPSVTAFAEQAKLALWIGTENGLDRFDPKDLTYTHFRASGGSNSLSDNRVTSLAYSTDGYLWIGTRSGLDRYDPFTGDFEHYEPDEDNASSIAGGEVNALLPDSSGGVWVGTSAGIDHIDNAFNLVGTYWHNPADSTSLSSNNVTTLFATSIDPGMLWVGTDMGLDRMDMNTGFVRRYEANPRIETALSDPYITSITVRSDSANALWIGTLSGGLNRLDLESNTFERFTRRSGAIPGNTVSSVVADQDGDLWVATNWGLARFDPVDGTTYVYDVDRGIQSRNFNIGAAFLTASGEIVVGGDNGFNLFSPKDFGSSPFPPRVVLTGYRIGEEAQGAGAEALLLSESIELGHSQNDLTFEFVGLHFSRPEQNHYRVQLRRTSADSVEWRNLGSQRTATYDNLAPGSYIFAVQAANADGVWSGESASVEIHISPPWWATWWFRIFAIAAVIGIAVFAFRWRIRRIAARNKELEGLVAERTEALQQQTEALASKNDELKSTLDQLQATQNQLVHAEKLASLGRLTAGVAHEIKNPLNFVNNFAQLSEELTEELRTELASSTNRSVADVMNEVELILNDLALNNAKIAEHGRRADSIVKSMLLHARGATGDPEMTPLHLLLDESIDLLMQGMARGGDGVQVHIERDYDPDVREIPIIRQAVGRVFLNLLENAFYAVNEAASTLDRTPTIRVRTMIEGNYVRVAVEDNGPGIPDDVRPRLFEPFFTTKPTGSGTGLGLSLAHDIVQRHNGTLRVQRTGPEGTVFTVRLPLFGELQEGAE
ncbi:MAG: two-component regulator propeller domain-containing protein, partial [Rubricoccaceae bacterium]|nr:two-component regulator propeller domain-containing protein [Rubricoccaceae bacterium]